jgi:hypothetical protein
MTRWLVFSSSDWPVIIISIRHTKFRLAIGSLGNYTFPLWLAYSQPDRGSRDSFKDKGRLRLDEFGEISDASREQRHEIEEL